MNGTSCQGDWQITCAWVQPSLSACPGSSLVPPQGGSFGTGGGWSQLVLACFCPLCLRPRGLIWLSQNNFSMCLMTFRGHCYCDLAVRRAAGTVCELGAITHLGDWCSQLSALRADGLSAGLSFQLQRARAEGSCGRGHPSCRRLHLF